MSEQTRFFTTFDRVSQSSITLANPVNLSLSRGFEIEVDFVYTTDPSTDARLLGFSGSPASLIKVFSSGDASAPFRLNFALGGVFSSVDNFMRQQDVGKLNKLKITTNGTSILFHLNGELRATRTINTSFTGMFDQIGSGGGFDFATDIIANVKIVDGGSLELDLPIDGNYTPANNTVFDKSGNNNNGTFINVAEGDSQDYLIKPDGTLKLVDILAVRRESNRRFFTTFDSVAQSYISFGSAVEIPSDADFTIRFDVIPDGSTQVVLGLSATTNTRARVLANGDIEWRTPAGSSTVTPSSLAQGELNTVSVTRRSGQGAISVNGVQAGGTLSLEGVSVTYDQIGRASNLAPTGAKVSDLSIWIGDDKVLDLPIDQNYTPTNNIVRDESVNANNGTFVNVADGDSELYTNTGEGSWTTGDVLEGQSFTNAGCSGKNSVKK